MLFMMFFNLDLAPKPNLWGSCRLSIAFSVFLASVHMALLRDNLGIALLCMSKPSGNLTCEPNDAIVPTLPWLNLKQVHVTMITYLHDVVYHRYINKCIYLHSLSLNFRFKCTIRHLSIPSHQLCLFLIL